MKTVKVAGDDPELIKFAYAEIPFSMLGPIVESFEDKSFCIDAEEVSDKAELNDIHKELKIDLMCRVYELIEDNFTNHQKLVIALVLEGMKNHEIAFLLGCNRTAIHNCINGIKDMKTGVVQGGYSRKLKKLVKNDEECLAILRGLR